jgi:hypothetical protein
VASAKSAAVRAYADEWSRQCLEDFRAIGVVQDVLATDVSGGVAQILRGMLSLAFKQSFLLATTLAHQEPSWREPAWVRELADEERSSVLQLAGYGPVPLSRAQMERPRLDVQQAIRRLRELEAQDTVLRGPSPAATVSASCREER